MSETEAFAAAAEVPPSGPPAPETGGGTAPEPPASKPRSGFARQKLKVEALKRRIQELEGDHETLLTDYEGLLADHDRLEQDYRALEAGFNELSQLNETLADELRKLKSHQQRPPIRYGSLMGGM
jgi:chromosome segregation ATPase